MAVRVREAAPRSTGCGNCPGTWLGHAGSLGAPWTGDTPEGPFPPWGDQGRNQATFRREASEVLPPPVGMAGSH